MFQACQEREEQYKPKLLLKPAEEPVGASPPPSPAPSPQNSTGARGDQTPAPEANHNRQSESEDESPPSDGPLEPEPQDENSLSRGEAPLYPAEPNDTCGARFKRQLPLVVYSFGR